MIRGHARTMALIEFVRTLRAHLGDELKDVARGPLGGREESRVGLVFTLGKAFRVLANMRTGPSTL